jgi:hypothetical protein
MLGFILERLSVQTDGLTEFQIVGKTLKEIEARTEREDRSISRSTRRGIDECLFGNDLTALRPITVMAIRTFILYTYLQGKRAYL